MSKFEKVLNTIFSDSNVQIAVEFKETLNFVRGNVRVFMTTSRQRHIGKLYFSYQGDNQAFNQSLELDANCIDADDSVAILAPIKAMSDALNSLEVKEAFIEQYSASQKEILQSSEEKVSRLTKQGYELITEESAKQIVDSLRTKALLSFENSNGYDRQSSFGYTSILENGTYSGGNIICEYKNGRAKYGTSIFDKLSRKDAIKRLVGNYAKSESIAKAA